MRLEVKEELENLKQKLQNNQMEIDKPNNFIEKWDYEYEYSGKEIDEIQTDFVYYAKKYLQEHYRGQYAIKNGISEVTIVSIDFLNRKNLKGWTIC